MKGGLFLLGLAVSAVLAAIALHERLDRERVRPAPAADATALYRRLAAGGIGILPELRLDAEEGGEALRPVLEALPREDEPWVKVAEAAVLGRNPDPAIDPGRAVVEPRGLVLPGRPVLRLRGFGEGPLTLRLLRLDGGPEGRASLAAASTVGPLPEALTLEPGARFALELRDAEDRVLGETRFETLPAEDAAALRRQAAALTPLVSDARLLRYAVGVLAMSRGLHDRAAAFLLDGMDETLDMRRERDLAWRRVFLLDRRGLVIKREQLAARLRGR
ncbi:MAG: hypothetical protein R3F20_11355 [Planctomycetota bacterium]